MHKVEVYIIQPEIFQRRADRRFHILRVVLAVPKLGGYEKFVARHQAAFYGVGYGAAYDFLVVVDIGVVQMEVSDFQRENNRIVNFFRLCLPCSKP